MARTIAGSAPGRTNRRFLIIAILLAGLSAALVYAKISAGSDSTGGEISAGSSQVVVAKQAIKQRTTLTAEMLTLKPVSSNNVIAGAFTSLDAAVGMVTKYPIEANQQVAATAVVDTTRPTGDAALAAVVPTGKRAMSINATKVSNAGGLILPGDFIDIIWICCDDKAILAKTVVQNVQVLAIAQTIIDAGPSQEGSEPVAAGEAEPDPEAVTTTLLLTPDEEHLLFMAELTGELRIGLRGVGDIDRASEDFTTVLELLPLEIVNQLPEELRPDGYKPGGAGR
jgi:pilus assembly protein CpaB